MAHPGVWTKKLLFIWYALLIPWAFVFMLSLLATMAGGRWWVEVFVWSILTYPFSVIAAFLFRERSALVVFLPALNLVLWLGSLQFH